jgi:ankyrin repeat protein
MDSEVCACLSCFHTGEVLEPEADPLHAAARRGCLKQVRDILKKGGVAVDAKDSEGFTPFAIASLNGHIG